jgi:hypothetical protein
MVSDQTPVRLKGAKSAAASDRLTEYVGNIE